MPAAGSAARGGQHEPVGCFGHVREQLGQDAGVGVGGEHEAAVPELGLHGLEVDAGQIRMPGLDGQ
jgi:hypothetical protein